MSKQIYCQSCGKRKDEVPEAMRRCSGCKCVHYCGIACRDADWPKHKRYCKRLLFVKKTDLPAFNHESFKARPDSSELYKSAVQTAEASEDAIEKGLALITPIVAEHFVKACAQDFLPANPAEEQIWGLYGNPSGQDYQKLLLCYQKGLKYGDLSASKLMECLLARPAASQALTKLLRKCKMVMTEGDSLQTVMHLADRYAELANSIVVDSEFDKWPLPGCDS